MIGFVARFAANANNVNANADPNAWSYTNGDGSRVSFGSNSIKRGMVTVLLSINTGKLSLFAPKKCSNCLSLTCSANEAMELRVDRSEKNANILGPNKAAINTPLNCRAVKAATWAFPNKSLTMAGRLAALPPKLDRIRNVDAENIAKRAVSGSASCK